MLFVVSGVVALSVTNMQQYVVEVGLTELNDALPLVKEDKVCTNVDPVLQVEVVDEYSFAVQSVVPPDHDEVNDTDCPESIVGLDGLIDGVPKAEFILKVEEYPDVTVFVPESVTTTFASSGELAVSALTVWKV